MIGHDGEPLGGTARRWSSATRASSRNAGTSSRCTGTDLPARSLADPDLELVDLFGNGLPDILEMNGTVRYWRNLGGGRFDLPARDARRTGGTRAWPTRACS